MEYLKTINDSLRTINEKNIKYMDLFDYPNFVYGNINYNSSKVDFCKYPLHIQKEMEQFGNLAMKEMKDLNSASCGNRIRFSTNSKKVIFKVQLKRTWEYKNIWRMTRGD